MLSLPLSRHLAALLLVTSARAASLSIASLSRTLELSGTVARAQTTLVCRADGEGDGHLELTLGDEDQKLAWLDVVEAKTKRPLAISEGTGSLEVVHVPADLIMGGNVSLAITEVYTHASEPRPKQLQQAGDAQLLWWSGDLMGGLSASAAIGEVKIRLKAPTANVKSYTTPAGFTANRPTGSGTITYSGTSVHGAQPASVHYEQPDPVISFRNYSRHVEVSHWGANLAIRDDLQLVNDGPQLKGQFSRLTHQQQGMMRSATGYNHVLSGIILNLPVGATDPYFVDTVGNVSTSHFRPSPPNRFARASSTSNRGATLELKPRYPIFGGWKYDFSIGYNLPLGLHLRRKGSLYHLAVPFMTTTKDTAVDLVETRIVLPEGATDVHVYPPFAADPRILAYTTFLDTIGRPAIVIRRAHCTAEHMVDILISYRYSSIALVQKPLAVASAAFAVFLLGIGLRRTTWQIGASHHHHQKLL